MTFTRPWSAQTKVNVTEKLENVNAPLTQKELPVNEVVAPTTAAGLVSVTALSNLLQSNRVHMLVLGTLRRHVVVCATKEDVVLTVL